MRARLGALAARYDIVHLCGAGKEEPTLEGPAYRQFAYLDEGYGDVLAAADRVVSRAGANGLFELLALRKISLLVPWGAAPAGAISWRIAPGLRPRAMP